jgi:hypothetical protein
MDRRDILKATAGLALSGCATSHSPSPRPTGPLATNDDVAQTLADVDSTIAKLSAVAPHPELYVQAVAGRPRTLPSLEELDVARAHNLMQRTFAALHISATFRDLPPDVQQREETQRRMWRAMPLLDGAMIDLSDYLETLSASDRRRIQAEIDKDPNLVMDIAGTLDDQAAAVGVPMRRRLQLRTAASHVSWRMTHQSVSALLDDVLGKVHRVRERHARDEELRRAIAAKVLEAELFAPPGDVTSRLTSANVYGDEEFISPQKHAARVRKAEIVLGVGGGLLLTGGIVAVIGGVTLSGGGGIGGAVAITVGAILGVAGLITLIVGLVLAVNAGDDKVSDTVSD